MITSKEKTKLINVYGNDPKNTGSTEVQIAVLTARIKDLTGHFKKHVKDHHSRRGLLKLVGKRRRLLRYLQRTSDENYKNLIKKLGIRK